MPIEGFQKCPTPMVTNRDNDNTKQTLESYLNTIHYYTKILLGETDLTEEQANFISIIEKNATQISDLVNQKLYPPQNHPSTDSKDSIDSNLNKEEFV